MKEIYDLRKFDLKSFDLAPMVLAFYKPMNARGMSTEELGYMMYGLFEMDIRYLPQDEVNRSASLFTEPYQ